MFKRVMSPGEGITGLHVGLFEKGWTLRKATDKDCILEVKVPGNVRAALVDAGIIADPFIGKNNETSKWVSDVSWVYSNTFSVPSLDALTGGDFPEGGMFHLVFDAIDYDATFCINGERVCRQTGMFSPVDVATGIVRGGKIRDEPFKIDVRFHVQPWWRQHAVKCQMAFGWDFAPEMRTVGIWKHVRAFLTGPAFFSDVFVNAVPLNATNPLNVKVSAKCVISIITFTAPGKIRAPVRDDLVLEIDDGNVRLPLAPLDQRVGDQRVILYFHEFNHCCLRYRTCPAQPAFREEPFHLGSHP